MAFLSNVFEEPSSFPPGHILSDSGEKRSPYDKVFAPGKLREDAYEPQCWSTATGIIGSSPALGRILDEVKIVAATDSTVLIDGETGTGKELIASAIHTLSLRRRSNFVRFNCS